MRSHTSFRAVGAGDTAAVGGESIPVVVLARAVATGHLRRKEARDGKWYLYRNGSRVFYACKLEPSRSGEKMCFELDAVSGGRWSGVLFDCYQMDRRGQEEIYISDIPRHVRGRLRTVFRKTSGLLGDKAPCAQPVTGRLPIL